MCRPRGCVLLSTNIHAAGGAVGGARSCSRGGIAAGLARILALGISVLAPNFV